MARYKNSKSPTPVYYKLQSDIQKEIESGGLEPGARIPPERLLAETHKISIGTVKRALSNLVNEGFLYRAQGRGTFVAGTTLRRDTLRYYRFLKQFRGDEANIKIKFLEISERDGFQPVNQHLKIRKNQPLYELRRVFLSSKKAIIYTISYLPQKIFPRLEEWPKSKFERLPIFISLEQNYGLPTIFNQELFGAVAADSDIAKVMNIKLGEPMLLIEMLAFTYKEKPYEYRQSYCLTDSNKVFREW